MAEIRVLIADDDSSMMDLMVRRLSRMGLQADRAEDGQKALEMIGRTAYDLILTDIYMPGATGLDILRQAKENDPHVQVVVVTGSASLDNAVEALNVGAFSFLTKPFEHLSVFDNAVSRALEFRRLIRDNLHLGEIQRRRGDMLEAEVTERIRQMRRKQQDLVELLSRLPQGVLVVDGDGRVVLSNPLAERWMADDARIPSQPLRGYLSTLEPPQEPVSCDLQLGGVRMRATAQVLPALEGKPRTLVMLEDAAATVGLEGGLLAPSLAKLRPGLEWLARQSLEARESEVVTFLLQQVDGLERLVREAGLAVGLEPAEFLRAPPLEAPMPVADQAEELDLAAFTFSAQTHAGETAWPPRLPSGREPEKSDAVPAPAPVPERQVTAEELFVVPGEEAVEGAPETVEAERPADQAAPVVEPEAPPRPVGVGTEGRGLSRRFGLKRGKTAEPKVAKEAAEGEPAKPLPGAPRPQPPSKEVDMEELLEAVREAGTGPLEEEGPAESAPVSSPEPSPAPPSRRSSKPLPWPPPLPSQYDGE